ncbi:L-threonine dehydrogenase [soil metagenome]
MTSLFRLPGEVRFGPGVSRSVSDDLQRLAASRVMIVSDPGIVAAGLLAPIESDLLAHGYTTSTFTGVSPNPRDFECIAAASAMNDFGADVVLAVGGGSPIDLAKAAIGIATNGGRPQDWITPRTFPRPPLPMVAIPTTAGTGSEVTRSSVINDTERSIKISIRDNQIAPRFAIVDPDLTLSLPPSLTAATGMDALTHAIEAYTGKSATPVTDALALHAIRLIATHLKTAVADGSNRQAREGMMMASVIAGIAFSNSDVAAVHCIAEAIGGRYDTPHGVANSLFLPYLFAFNAESNHQRHADVAVAMGVAAQDDSPASAARKAAQALTDLGRDIGIPAFKQVPGIKQDDFPWIAATSRENLSNESNARTMTEADYLSILDQAWNA